MVKNFADAGLTTFLLSFFMIINSGYHIINRAVRDAINEQCHFLQPPHKSHPKQLYQNILPDLQGLKFTILDSLQPFDFDNFQTEHPIEVVMVRKLEFSFL